MSALQQPMEPTTDIEGLIQEIFVSEEMVFTIAAGDNLSVAELMGKNTPTFHGGWWNVETDAWHIHAQLSAIRRVRFVREPNTHGTGAESLSIQFAGPNGESLLNCYFIHLYDDRNQPIAARFGRWEELRAKCGGCDEVGVENGALATRRERP